MIHGHKNDPFVTTGFWLPLIVLVPAAGTVIVSTFYTFEEDTTGLSVTAFGVVAGLSALALALAALVDPKADGESRRAFREAGELLLYGSCHFLTSTLLKYALVLLRAKERFADHPTLRDLSESALRVSFIASFSIGVILALWGYAVLNHVLYARLFGLRPPSDTPP